MPVFLNSGDADFGSQFAELLNAKRSVQKDVSGQVSAIIEEVRTGGDQAVLELTRRFDQLELTADQLAFTESEIDAAISTIPEMEVKALELAAERIRAYHNRQLPEDASWQDKSGARLGWRWNAVEAAGLYVPGGLASYPSSVLMNAIPASVAGVERLVIATPTPAGKVNPLVLLAARLSGVSEIYRIGGAQAIAALAFGTQTIAKVDKITGPGNDYVAEAKRQVFGIVGIDMIAGPSEILVIAERQNDPDWIALDLLSQAEHDETAQAILITDDAEFAKQVTAAVERRLETLERRQIAAKSWQDYGAVIISKNLDEAATLSDQFAPEHLELCVAEPEVLAQKVRHAGAIFLGNWTPEAIGDYVGGPNHVLPTSRSARFSSGLSVLDFMKRTTMAGMGPGALGRIGPAAVALARSEGLEAHGLSVQVRLDKVNEG